MLFPSPLEVDRFLYYKKDNNVLKLSQFPSPLEVDRFLYVEGNLTYCTAPEVSGPSRGRLVAIRLDPNEQRNLRPVSGPSRGG